MFYTIFKVIVKNNFQYLDNMKKFCLIAISNPMGHDSNSIKNFMYNPDG